MGLLAAQVSGWGYWLQRSVGEANGSMSQWAELLATQVSRWGYWLDRSVMTTHTVLGLRHHGGFSLDRVRQ